MLLHLVLFKYRPEIDAAARADHRDRLATLKSLDGVIDLKVGEDVVRSPRSYDTGLAVTFPDRAALDAYQTNEQHVPIAKHGAGLCEHIAAVDFEI
jgi:hypothetical protein